MGVSERAHLRAEQKKVAANAKSRKRLEKHRCDAPHAVSRVRAYKGHVGALGT